MQWIDVHVNKPTWCIKIQPETIDLSVRLWGINTEFVGFIPPSFVLRSILLGWILLYRNWSITGIQLVKKMYFHIFWVIFSICFTFFQHFESNKYEDGWNEFCPLVAIAWWRSSAAATQLEERSEKKSVQRPEKNSACERDSNPRPLRYQ